jgi:hypothetical protein
MSRATVEEYVQLANLQFRTISEKIEDAKTNTGLLSIRIPGPVLDIVVQKLREKYPTWQFSNMIGFSTPHECYLQITYVYWHPSGQPTQVSSVDIK